MLAQAVTHQRAGRLGAALAIYERLLRAHPGRADILQMRGLLDVERGDAEAALEWMERAAARAPRAGSVQVNLAMIYAMLARLGDARAAYERACALMPDHPRPRLGLVGVLRSMGEGEQAERLAREVTARHPEEPEAPLALGELLLERDPEESERIIRGVVARAGPDARLRASALFVLGRLLDRAERYDEAFAAVAEANRLRGKVFDPDAFDAIASRVIEAFDAPTIERLSAAGAATRVPVVVVGMPRSGTSLTEQIIQMHAGVVAGGERTVLHRAARDLPGWLGSAQAFPACVRDASVERWAEASKRICAMVESAAPGAVRITDKLPSNFVRVGLIASTLPGACIVHCTRDARDTCLSAFFQDFLGQTIAASGDLRHLGRYYRAYARLMRHWKRVLGERVLDVAYADLVHEPEAATRRLMAHVGVAWDPACLRFHESGRAVATASAQQVRKSLYTTSVGRWKHYERHLGPLIEALGDDAGQ